MNDDLFSRAVQCLKSGGVIAYPTESVFGLGCDANNLPAVSRILKIKNRAANKGLIMLVGDILQAYRFVQPLNDEQLAKITAPSERAITWLLGKSANVSDLIAGGHPKIAIRITTHPVARALCGQLGSPIISTSCNLSGSPAFTNAELVLKHMNSQVDLILDGECGGEAPSKIVDLDTGEQFR